MNHAQASSWEPSPKQADLLRVAREPVVGRSVTSMCKRAGVHRATFYEWLKSDPGFRSAWGRVVSDALELHLPAVTAAVIAQARRGDVPAARLVFELAGLLKKRVEVTGQDGGPVRTIDLSALTAAQLDALIALDPRIATRGDSESGPPLALSPPG